MKFILWTTVWFGFIEIDRIIDLFWWGNQAAVDARYSRDVQGGAAFITLLCWILCYVFIIRSEKTAAEN